MITKALRILLTRSLKPFTFTNVSSKSLEFVEQPDLGLYVHIPFCRSICSFCPYCKVKYDQKLAYEYKKALLNEIDLVCQQVKEKKEVTSLYFGGGTPALMIDDLADIIAKLQEYFIIKEGIGVELHPDDINDVNLKKLKDAKITMVSLGIQSFDSTCLDTLGRKENDFIKKLQLVKTYDFAAVDVDLIFAIANQSEQTIINDIKTAFANGATQVSTYPFIDFTFANNRYKPMPERTKKKLLKSIVEYTENNKIQRTSVWTFAKPNSEKYSSVTRDSFLGFGVSATTLLKKEFKINTFSIKDYIERINQSQLPTSLTINFTKRQRACYYLFWSAYSMHIDANKYEDMIGSPLNKMYGFELFVCKILGLVTQNKNEYYLTEKGAYYYHYMEQAYTTAYIDKMWNVSRVKAFPEKVILK